MGNRYPSLLKKTFRQRKWANLLKLLSLSAELFILLLAEIEIELLQVVMLLMGGFMGEISTTLCSIGDKHAIVFKYVYKSK